MGGAVCSPPGAEVALCQEAGLSMVLGKKDKRRHPGNSRLGGTGVGKRLRGCAGQSDKRYSVQEEPRRDWKK